METTTTITNTDTRHWVYTHTTPDGMVYVGQSAYETTNLRWVESHYKPHTVFGREIKKWGWENISHDVVAVNLTHDDALRLEGELIDFCKANGVSLNERRSGNQWSGTAKEAWYFANRDKYLKNQRKRHWTKKWNRQLEEQGYIPLW